MIVTETAYGFTTDSNGDNTIFTRELCKDVPYPPSPKGQKNFLQDLSARLRYIKNNRGKGFFYWEPEWIPARGVSWATYSEYVLTSVFLQSPQKFTLALGLQSFITNQFAAHWTLFAAASVLASLPIMILFMALQKFIQSGLTAGGVKE